jgi:hypothetical protein
MGGIFLSQKAAYVASNEREKDENSWIERKWGLFLQHQNKKQKKVITKK